MAHHLRSALTTPAAAAAAAAGAAPSSTSDMAPGLAYSEPPAGGANFSALLTVTTKP